MATAVNKMNKPIQTVKRILVMEDSPVQAQVLQEILQSESLEVEVAHDGHEGLRLLRASSFDLVLSDVMMPRLSGYEVCRQIKSDEALKQIPVVLITRLRDPWDIVEGLECGADGFIMKPYEADYLIGRLRSILANKAIQDETELTIGVEMKLLGKTVKITPDKQQIFGLLVSTIEEFVRTRNREQESQRVQRVLLESQKTLQSTLDGMSSGITVIDRSGTIVAINAAWQRCDWSTSLFNNSGAIGSNYLEMCRSAAGEQRQALVAVGESICQILTRTRDQVEEEVCCGTGKDQRWFYIKATRIESDGRGAVVITHDDISLRRRAEESLRMNEEQLRQAQKMEAVGRLAGGVAHDFNNMLCIILGYSESLREDLTPSHPMYVAIKAIHEAGSRAAALTKQLLLFSRKQAASPQTLDLNKVISQIEKMLCRLISEDIELVTVLDPAPALVRADAGHIEQIIMNLAVNARDAMPNGGRLVIKVARIQVEADTPGADKAGGGRVMLSVSDTGCGMDQATKERIFEPFFTTKARGEGTGLGLATVYGIVKQAQGGIYAESEMGTMTSFTVYLPVTDEEVSTPVVHTQVGAVDEATILVVEDEDPVRELIVRILRRGGFEVIGVASGAEAVEICSARQSKIDLLLTDVVMPRMSGPALRDVVLPLRPEMRVLFMSGYTDELIAKRGVLDVGEDLINKPFNSNQLLARVRAALNFEEGAT